MNKIRVSVVLLLLWLLSFYLVDWWSPRLKFAPAADVLLLATTVGLLAIPGLQNLKLGLLLPALIALLLAAKWATGAPLLDGGLPNTVTEACALTVTALLARYVSSGIAAFEEAVVHMTVGQIKERRARYGEVYNEVRRARLHHRPLSVLAVRYEGTSVNVAHDRIVHEAQEAMVKHYLLASVAKVLNDALDDFNIVARRGDHFLVLLPETPAEALPETIQRLRRASLEQVGINLQIGAACLPDDATTLEGLMDKATAGMQSDEVSAAMAQPVNNFELEGVSMPEASHGNVDRQ
jgi:GGDEF domain-containing protein